MRYDPALSTPEAGIHRFWAEDADGTSVLVTKQDVAPILERNKAMQTANDGYSPSRELRRVASIPIGVQLKWIEEYGVDPLHPHHKDLLRKLLNSSDYAYLRTAPGRL